MSPAMFACFVQPVQPTLSVPCKVQQKIPHVASVSDVPDVMRHKNPIGSWLTVNQGAAASAVLVSEAE